MRVCCGSSDALLRVPVSAALVIECPTELNARAVPVRIGGWEAGTESARSLRFPLIPESSPSEYRSEEDRARVAARTSGYQVGRELSRELWMTARVEKRCSMASPARRSSRPRV